MRGRSSRWRHRGFLSHLAAVVLLLAAQPRPIAAASGPIRIDPAYPHSFRFQDGERFFPMGDTAYFLISKPTNVIAHFIDVRRARQFNFIRLMPMDEGHWPFRGTPTKPDYNVIRESAMRKLDWVFDYAALQGMNIELILWGYGVGGGEGLWASPAHQSLWIDTLVKRYRDRANLFMYTIANEFERYPDGKYNYEAGDVEWAKSVAARIRSLDATHPTGVHPSVWITRDNPFHSYKTFTQRRPPVVWPLWENSPVNLNITQNNEGVQPRTWGNYDANQRGLTYYPTNFEGVDYPARWTAEGWDFEAAGLEDSIAEDWAAGRPVLNTEFGYQFERGYGSGSSFKSRQAHLPSTVRKKSMENRDGGRGISRPALSARPRRAPSTLMTSTTSGPGTLRRSMSFSPPRPSIGRWPHTSSVWHRTMSCWLCRGWNTSPISLVGEPIPST